MTEFIEPTKSEFENAEATAIDTVTTQYPAIQTKAGSVIRELVIRPLSYLYAWCVANITNLRQQYSVSYLKTSQRTDNEIADQVASNWFITRKQGTTAQGVITLTATTATVQVAAGSVFTVGGIDMHTEYRIMSDNSRETYGLIGDTLYVQAIPFGTSFLVNLPVVATEAGAIEIEPGAYVELNFNDSTIENAQLTSAVTGGSDTETDAQMIARAESNTAEAGIGSWHGYRRKLDYAPVAVLGMGLVSGESAPLRRARYNTVNLNIGGFVDCYVKTQTQPSIGTVEVASSVNGTTHTVTLTDANCGTMDGFYAITGLVAGGVAITNYSVTFSGPTGDASDYRLSTAQTAIITFTNAATTSLTVAVSLAYMPGVAILQQYLDYADNKFVGQDAIVKAAVPAQMHLTCVATSATEITDDIMAQLKKTISDTVNALAVGVPSVNFSDIRSACHNALPSVELRLPCTMTADVYNVLGGVERYYSDTGVLSLTDASSQYAWSPDVCFFSLIQNNIRIDVI